MCRRDLAVVLVSGGMDSCIAAAIASIDHSLAFLHVNYGQLTERRELKAFRDICDYFKPVKILEADLPYFKMIGGSALTDHSISLSGTGGKDGIPSSYVPFRNAHALSVAVSWAEVIGACKVYIGVVEEDSSGYPDCREDFINKFQLAVDAGTRPDTRIKIVAPLLHKTKKQIVEIGMHLGAPFQLTWSCYKNHDKACGVCDSCRLRLKGFSEAGVTDPIEYETNTR